MKWYIVADSSCDLFPDDVTEAGARFAMSDGESQPSANDDPVDIGFGTVPFVMQVGGIDFVDDENIDVEDMLEAMENEREASSTACPSPGAFEEMFRRGDNVICITISSRLSGCFESADIARRSLLEVEPERNIAILDSCATGPESALCIDMMVRWIRQGLSFEEVIANAQAFLDETRTTFALKSFHNLVKNGRMLKLVGFLAGRLGVWGIGIGSERGEIVIKGKGRGSAKAVKIILDDMYQRGYSGGRVLISHAINHEFAEQLAQGIHNHWDSAEVHIIPARGLDAFYAERGGVIVGY